MLKELVVSSSAHETKVAILEDDQLAEVYFEQANEYSIAGSIYKGRVTRVLPGMQSAFVDIGLERDAFLYVSDFLEDTEAYDKIVTGAEDRVARIGEPAQPAPGRPVHMPPVAPAAAPPAESLGAESGPDAGAVPAATPEGQAPAAGRPLGEERGGRRRRRGRRGRYRDRGFPDSKYATRADVTPPRLSQLPQPPAAEQEIAVLPGESLAKYRHLTTPPAEETAGEESAAGEPPAAEEAAESSVSQVEMREPSSWEEEVRDEPPLQEERPGVSESFAQVERGPATEDSIVEAPNISASELAAERVEEMLDQAAESAEQPALAPAAREAFSDAFRGQTLGTAPSQSAEPGEAITAQSAAPEEDLSASAVEEAPSDDSVFPAVGEHSAPAAPSAGARSLPTRPAEPPAERAEVRGQADSARFTHRVSRRMRRRMTREDRPPQRPEPPERPTRGLPLISDLLREGQEILVQVAKEPLGKKGARITSHIALPGRYVVHMPTVDHIGVSRKIGSDEERQRLKRLLLDVRRTVPGGFIIRTAGEGRSEEELRQDMTFLHQQWVAIRARAERSAAPALLHRDLNLVERILRDQLSDEFRSVWVDNEQEYEKILEFAQAVQPSLVPRVKLYTKQTPIFEEFNIQEEINKALKPKVWLKSGGYIVINQTEALVSIDINTGKYVGKTQRLEDTIVKTNVEAIKEIVRQIRLRDLGGIIVIDFIDMDERKNRVRVMQALDEELRHDRAPSKVLAFNDFGLVAITRKRVKQSLERTLCTLCPDCSGSGLVKSPHTVAMEILAEASKLAPFPHTKQITLRVNPEVARYLKQRDVTVVQEIEEMAHKTVFVKSDPNLHHESFDFN